jgi:septation ring formation regulator EzrA
MNNNQKLSHNLYLIKEKVKYLELQLVHVKAEMHQLQENLFDLEDQEMEAMAKYFNAN